MTEINRSLNDLTTKDDMEKLIKEIEALRDAQCTHGMRKLMNKVIALIRKHEAAGVDNALSPYYECHITCEVDKRRPLKHIVEQELGWKFSCIDGDPSLGIGIKCYATQHFRGGRLRDEVILIMDKTAKLLEADGFKVLRQKVELVIYDTKLKRSEQNHDAY